MQSEQIVSERILFSFKLVARNTPASCIRRLLVQKPRAHRRRGATPAASADIADGPGRAHRMTTAAGLRRPRSRIPDASRTFALDTGGDRRTRALRRWCA